MSGSSGEAEPLAWALGHGFISLSPEEGEVRGDNEGSQVTRGLEQPGPAAGGELPSICPCPWLRVVWGQG